MNVHLDAIIFALQRHGGISNYWAKLIESVYEDSNLNINFTFPSAINYRNFNNKWLLLPGLEIEYLNYKISRYLKANVFNSNEVFHTSYYRLPNSHVKRYVVTVYDFTYEYFRKGIPRKVHSNQKLASIRCADVVICISESTRRDLIEFCPDVDEGKLFVVPLGLDRDEFYPDAPIAETCINVYEGMVLFVGQRDGYKRFDLAVDAIRGSTDLMLGIVGPPLSNREKFFLQSQLGSRWVEFGPVSTHLLRQLYSIAFAFIFPSNYEGFGLPILEAMACGCPVVAAGLSSLPEVGGDAAYYAASQTGDEYAWLLSGLGDRELRKEMIRRGFERASKFSWLQTTEATKKLYLA